MLELSGIPYLTDCVIRAAEKRISIERFQVYVTDCLYALCAGFGGQMGKRYSEILHPQKDEDKPTEVIVEERLERFGIKVVD